MSIRAANGAVAAAAPKRGRTAGSTQILAMVLVPIIVGVVAWGVMQLESTSSGSDSVQSFMDEPERAVGDVSAVANGLAGGDYSSGQAESALNRYNNMNADRQYRSQSTAPSRGGSSGIFGKVKRALGFGPKAPDVPAWVPIFPGSISEGRIQQDTEIGRKEVVRATVGATSRSVVTFYNHAFEQRGYTFTAEESAGETVFSAESPDGIRTATIAISGSGVRSTISITYMDRS
jgi:hypothetical protein